MIEIGIFSDSKIFRDNFLNHQQHSLDPFIKKSTIKWFNPLTEPKNITDFTDQFLNHKQVKNYQSKVKIIILMEPLETGVWNRNQISKLEPYVDFILTFDDLLLSTLSKARPYVPGGTFIGSNESLPSTINKNQLISIVASNKKDTVGHKMRHQIIEQLGPEFKIKALGSGYSPFKMRFEPYADYAFTIVVENLKNENLLTEKVVDPILFQTIPIYWGGNIENCFNPRGVISFQDIPQLKSILQTLSLKDYEKFKPFLEENQKHAAKLLSKELNIENSLREVLQSDFGLIASGDDYSALEVNLISGRSSLMDSGNKVDSSQTSSSAFPGVELKRGLYLRFKIWVRAKIAFWNGK